MYTKEYLLSRVNMNQGTGCWEWNLSHNPSTGYGQIGKKPYTVHKLAFILYNGREPEGILRHLCHNKSCCNPNHLAEGNHKDNYEDSRGKYERANEGRRKQWSVDGVNYGTIREAVRATGICSNTMQKFTEDGVFNIESYRESCKIAGWIPKI